MTEILSGTSEEIALKKRGRKSQKENYFDIREENAVKDFLIAETAEEKNKIYNEFLRSPLDKMISSIIRRYKLYRKDMDFNEIHTDNYLMGQIIKDQKEMNRKVSYEDISSALEERADLSYTIDNEVLEMDSVIASYLDELKEFVVGDELNDNEKKLVYALIELFDNYQTIFFGSQNNKFNKNIILLSLREMTNLNTKEIRTSIKRFKKLYLVVHSRLKN